MQTSEVNQVRRALQIGLVMVLAGAGVLGQDSKVFREGDTWVEQVTGTLSGARNLKLITDMGSVHVEGGSQSEITYTIVKRVHAYSEQDARREFETIRISAGNSGETAWIRGQSPRYSGRHDFGADFQVNVPNSIALVSAHTGGGNLAVRNIRGKLEAETGGGNVDLDNISDDIDAQSGGGNVTVGTVGAELKIETGGGRIHISNASGPVEAQSGGGNIEIGTCRQGAQVETGGGSISVGNCGGDLNAQTGGGSINAGQINGSAKLETGGGGIHLAGANGPVTAETGGGSLELYKMTHGAKAETGSGGIIAEFIGNGIDFGDSRLESASGDIRVFLPQNLPVTVYASVDVSDGHSIHTQFDDLKVSSEEDSDGMGGPRESYCQGKLNGGGRSLHVHTTTGSIDFVRTTASAGKPHD